MAKEIELKFAASPAQLAQICTALPGPYETVSMETTYYDTPAGDLSARKWTLRRRLENGVSVCTLKTPAEGHSRNEWECRADSIEDAVAELCKLSSLPDLKSLTAGSIVPVCGARFTRKACLLELDGATAELALDEGILFGSHRELPFAEVEVELKSGEEAAIVAFSRILAARFGLTVEHRSKFRRALALAKGD